jgi:hypothetical protein
VTDRTDHPHTPHRQWRLFQNEVINSINLFMDSLYVLKAYEAASMDAYNIQDAQIQWHLIRRTSPFCRRRWRVRRHLV